MIDEPALVRPRADRPGARRRAPSSRGTSRSTSALTPTSYQAELRQAAERAGTDESVLTGRGLVRGRPVAVVVNEFALPRRVDRPRRRGPDHRPPYAGRPPRGFRCSPPPPPAAPACRRAPRRSFEMVEISRARDGPPRRRAALPRAPAAPDDRRCLRVVGLARPRDRRRARRAGRASSARRSTRRSRDTRSRPGVQRAENLAEKGVIDAVVAAEELPELIDLTLAVLVDRPEPPALPAASARARLGDRRRGRRSSDTGHPDRARRTRPAAVRRPRHPRAERHRGGRAATPTVLVDADPARRPAVRGRRPGPAPGRPGPRRWGRRRCARRDAGCAWPRSSGLPLVTVIDTPGAELSLAAEEGAIAGEIARCIATLTTMTVPTVSVILGQGCGGGALALLPAQVVVATENAWLSPLPPEGASVIRYGDVDHAPEMAESQGIGSAALVESGIVQHVVPELPDDDAQSLARAVAATVANDTGPAGLVRSLRSERSERLETTDHRWSLRRRVLRCLVCPLASLAARPPVVLEHRVLQLSRPTERGSDGRSRGWPTRR